MKSILQAATVFSVAAILMLIGFLVYFALPILTSNHLGDIFSTTWLPAKGHFGIVPMIVGSALLSASATVIAFPIALGFCSFVYAFHDTAIGRFVQSVTHLMTAIPTVIIGFVSVFVLVPLVRDLFHYGTGFSLLTAVAALSLLIFPTIVLILNAHIRQLDPSLRIIGAGMGISPMQQFYHIIAPASFRGMVTAGVLGFCRASGDAMIPLMLAGNAAQIPAGPLDSIRSVTAHIALVIATDSQSLAYQSVYAAGLILFLMTALVTVYVQRLLRIPGKKS